MISISFLLLIAASVPALLAARIWWMVTGCGDDLGETLYRPTFGR